MDAAYRGSGSMIGTALMASEPEDSTAIRRLEREVAQLRRLHDATVSLVGEVHPLRPLRGLLRSLGELTGTGDLFVAVLDRPAGRWMEIALAT